MENVFFDHESLFDASMNYTNMCLESTIISCMQDMVENHYVTESARNSLWTQFKKFFAKIILALKDFSKELKTKLEHTINEKRIKQKLKSMRQELQEKRERGTETVEMIDYEGMLDVFNQYYKSLISYAKKFAKVKYTKVWQIDDDLKEFNNQVENFNAVLENASNKKVRWHINKAIKFVEDELDGKSNVFNALNDSISDFAEIERIAEGLRTRMNILGMDVIPKHVGFIQKIINTISAFIRRWTVKIIMGIAFIFV